MFYYFVHVAETSYQGKEPLVYSNDEPLLPGTIVKVPYGKKLVLGFVLSDTNKPSFVTKQMSEIVVDLPLPDALIRLHEWMKEYYPGSNGATTQLFVPSGIATNPRKKLPGSAVKISKLPPLTTEQKSLIDEVNKSNKKSFLIHGETGSGKTRVYLEKTQETIDQGKSVLILTPEISLVPQLENVVRGSFDVPVLTLHSGLSKSVRTRNWLKILSNDGPVIVIGTRSAIFAPLKNLGLIVIDEMHEPAYKQESAPYYYGLRVAARLARIHESIILYGSATPPVLEYYVAEQTDTPILRMLQTAIPSEKVKRTILDLKDTKLFSRHRSLSDPLLDAVAARLLKKEQVLLFLNRRGTARQIICQTCGWQALCPRCDIPLTYHGDDHTMRCHICAYRGAPPYQCPDCKSDDIIYRSLGTKALVEALHSLFPEAIIRRFDTDNLTSEQLDKHYEDVHLGKIDILVGTQMLGKGLDLPKLSLVGIVNADTSMNVPDYSSSERSYQLLHQAIGRVGRGHLNGEVIVQTFNPNNPLLIASVNQDWQSLYDNEILERQQFGFPPFYFLLKISVSRKSSLSAENYTGRLYKEALKSGLKISINEPTPSYYEKTYTQYNWQLIIKAKQRGQLIELIKILPKGDWSYDIDPINLL